MSNWKLVRNDVIVTVSESTRGNGRAGFRGRGSLYLYVGSKAYTIKIPAFALVLTETVLTNDKLYHCNGHITDAAKKQVPELRNLRVGSVTHDYTDWGAPVGKPAGAYRATPGGASASSVHLFT